MLRQQDNSLLYLMFAFLKLSNDAFLRLLISHSIHVVGLQVTLFSAVKRCSLIVVLPHIPLLKPRLL